MRIPLRYPMVQIVAAVLHGGILAEHADGAIGSDFDTANFKPALPGTFHGFDHVAFSEQAAPTAAGLRSL
jgi:hypothetical protein